MPFFFGSDGPAVPPGHLFTPNAIGGISAVYELDVLVLLMTILSCAHAYASNQLSLAIAGLGLGLVVEHASLRLGGTHCHQTGLINFSECSSVNSVVYYLPWVYSCVTLARRLVDERSWSFPLLCGLFFFGMCGVYESQGPMMGWWLWPQPDMVVKGGCDIAQFGIPADDTRGLVASKHAYDALHDRVFGVPALAPYFHFAFGWGIAVAFQLVNFSSGLGAALLCVLGGPAIAMIWDPPIRVLHHLLGTDQAAGAMALMGLALALPMLVGVPLRTGQKTDMMLFAIPMLNECFFVYNALLGRGAGVLPPTLKLFVLTVAIVASVGYARAAGVLTATPPPDAAATRVRGRPSWLDRLQKDAQASEMDYTNTHPAVFIGLTLVQPLAMAYVAHLVGVPPALALLPIASHALMFVVSHYVLRSDKYFDITGETTFFPLILFSHTLCVGEASARQTLLTGLALLWCARLGLFLGIRIFIRGSDWRFTKLMGGSAYNAFGWVCQGTWIFLQGFCLWACHTAPAEAAHAPLTPVDYIGALVCILGLVIEHTSDMQKSRWNAKYTSGAQKTWLNEGLWRYSRHPNYFGENLTWFGMAMVAAGGLSSWSSVALAFVSPLWSAFFLLFTSLMLLEKRLDAKFGGSKAYEEYKRVTSVLLLWPPAKA